MNVRSGAVARVAADAAGSREPDPAPGRAPLVPEHHPPGLGERAGSPWRTRGRGVRLEPKHLRRPVPTQAPPRPGEAADRRGGIRAGEIVTTPER